MYVILLTLSSVLAIVLIEVLKRKFDLSTNITRRLVHILTAVVAGISPLFASKAEIIYISLVFAVVLFYGRKRKVFKSIYIIDRKSYGEVFLPLGVVLSAVFFLPNDIHAFQFGIFIMGISDALAGLVGERFRWYKINFWGHEKSVGGSVAFFFSSLVIAFLFFTEISRGVIPLALSLTIFEVVLVYGMDNLFLPVVASYFATIFL